MSGRARRRQAIGSEETGARAAGAAARRISMAMIAALAVLASACGGDSPTAPGGGGGGSGGGGGEPEPRAPATGNWTGSAIDYRDEGEAHRVELDLEQSGTTVSGTIVSRLFSHPDDVDGETWNRVYPVEGTITADGEMQLTARGVEGGGCYDLRMTMQNGLSEPQDHFDPDSRVPLFSGEYAVTDTRDGCGRAALGRSRSVVVMLDS